MSTPNPDPVDHLFQQAILDSPPPAAPLAQTPEVSVTVIPIDDDDPIAGLMDAAAEQARRHHDQGGRS